MAMAPATSSAWRVLIIGGGIGGLCLAQGLNRNGVRAEVFEANSDAGPSTESYSIDINAFGNHALRACLPEPLWDAYVAIAGQQLRGISFVTEQLAPLLSVDWPPVGREEDSDWRVSRNKLRQVLLTGLDGTVHFGKRFTQFEMAADSQVQARFADGTAAVGNVLIGADGVGSKVRRQLLSSAKVEDLRIAAIGAKLPFASIGASAWLPSGLTDRMTIVAPPSGSGMFMTKYQRTARRAAVPEVPPELLAPDLEDHVFWALIARRDKFAGTGDLRQLPPEAKRELVLDIVRSWDPVLRRLVAESALPSFTAISLQSSTKPKEWNTTNVTLLGDAIHTMTPLQGLGGNTALRDAALLCDNLGLAHAGRIDLLTALHDYEAKMRQYAEDAVRVSRQYTEQIVTDNRLSRAGFRIFLRVADSIPALKNRLFPPTHLKVRTYN
jgi:2-polyprenyl-6-methoxyphenol hydroxylase-like FAD-dependent oxidoreductase